MTRLVIRSFGGVAPKISKAKLPAPLAQLARNAKTWSGSLRAFRRQLYQQALTKTGMIQALYYYSAVSTWLHWTQDVSVAKNQQSGDTLDKIYYTGTDKPRVTTNTLYSGVSPGTSFPPASYILGIPTPADTPSGVDSGVAGLPNGTYKLVFTYVRVWSDGTVDESAPSPVSAGVVVASKKITWTVPETTIPTVGNYNITHKRLYRLNTGATSADYLYLDQIAVGVTSYTDNTADTSLGAAVTTTNDLPAPDALDGIIALDNGIYVGFAGRTIYCSAPYRAHAYPELNQYAIPDTIVGLGAFGTTVVVLTDGRARVGQVLDPAAVNFEPIQLSRPCASKRSIVSTQFGVFYSSIDGIAKVSPGGYDLVTRQLFGRDEWASYFPSTIHAYWLEDRYIGFYKSGTNADGTYQGGGFSFDPSGGGPNTFLPLDFVAYAGHVVPGEDQLYLATKDSGLSNQVEKWEGATNVYLQNVWRSPVMVVTPPTTFSYGMIEADFESSLTPAQIAAIAAQNVTARAANAARIATLNGGAFNNQAVNVAQVNGDPGMQPIQDTTTSAVATFRLYADGALIDQYDVSSSDPFALVLGSGVSPSTRFELEVSSTMEIYSVGVANDADELQGA